MGLDILKGLILILIKNWYIILLFIAVIFLISYLKSAKFKGWLGEKATSVGIGFKLDPAIYKVISDIIIPDKEGTTQIDHVVVSKYGIFVIEVKNYNGWIFGNEKDAEWIQVLYKKKSRFQNPLRQNYRHIKALVDYLKLDEKYFHSVIFFPGDSKFKTKMPANVLTSNLSNYIKTFNKPLLSAQTEKYVTETLQGIKNNPVVSMKEHVRLLKEGHKRTENM